MSGDAEQLGRPAPRKPTLVFFHSERSGVCRRAESTLAQVLQQHRNHETFDVRRVAADRRADLHERFRVTQMPTFVVIEDRKVRARLEGLPDCRSLEGFLAPWLR
jgi:thioredoxin-like negative regulator of GroEL